MYGDGLIRWHLSIKESTPGIRTLITGKIGRKSKFTSRDALVEGARVASSMKFTNPVETMKLSKDSRCISVVMQIQNMQNTDTKYVPLSDQAKAVILGAILGDGSLKIQSKYSNAGLQIRHSETQKDYLLWKAAMLQEIATDRSINVQEPDGYSKNRKWRFVSKRLPSLTELHHLTHQHNTLRIKRTWLNTMTPLSLAVWWCDDGSLISYGGRKGVFCTDGFDEASVRILARYLGVVWNIRTIVAPVGHKRDGTKEQYWRIWIRSTEELQKFLRIILPHVPLCMIHKTILLYKDPQFQQRWISEIIRLTHFPRDAVMAAYENKRARWKDF